MVYYTSTQGLWERAFIRYIDPDPESQEGAFESRKGPLASLSHRRFILIFPLNLYVQLFLVYLKK